MKNLTFTVITILLITIVPLTLFSQAPEKIDFQAEARDISGNAISNQNIEVRLTVIKGPLPGTNVYIEIHTTTTDGYGLFTLPIGIGDPITGTFADIDWGNGTYFVQVEIDPNGQGFISMGTMELMSVPYALYADRADPIGAIIMYSGTWDFDGTGLGTGKLAGWALCNGSNGTPDLMDRFVLATTSSSSLGDIGGANSFSLTSGQIPSHTHDFSTSSSGNHSHNITINNSGSHSHSYWNTGWWSYPEGYGLVAQEGGIARFVDANDDEWDEIYTSSSGSHNHSASSSSTGSHTHSGTTNSIGSGNSIDNRPAFIKLAYIMRIK